VEQVTLVGRAERRAPRAVRRGVEQNDLERRTPSPGGPREVHRGQAPGRAGADHDHPRCGRCLAHGSLLLLPIGSFSTYLLYFDLLDQLLTTLGGSPTVSRWRSSRSHAASPSTASWSCASDTRTPAARPCWSSAPTGSS